MPLFFVSLLAFIEKGQRQMWDSTSIKSLTKYRTGSWNLDINFELEKKHYIASYLQEQ